jgi:hypothetical protein
LPTLINMWNVNERFDAPLILEKLALAGFQVSSSGGVVRVEKYGCASEFRRTQDNHYQMTILPSILAGGRFTRLWDAGYQKFLLLDDGRKSPALAPQLGCLRQFNEALRTALGIPTYYNEALGSTCRVTNYDRVKGRPDEPPERATKVRASVEP